MSQHRPDVDNILATVREFIDSCAPHLDGEMRYHAQVSSYLLGICARELRLGPAHDANQRDRLAALLGSDATTAVLNAELAAGLRAGRFDAIFPQVLETLLALSADQVAVVRPDHLAACHRTGRPYAEKG
jgi:hypothetical protein